jgi:mediator of replication checkpoint protein 1
LQPAFQVDEKLLRKADAIFEKEQGYVVEAAGNPDAKESEFYVNEVG